VRREIQIGVTKLLFFTGCDTLLPGRHTVLSKLHTGICCLHNQGA